MNNIFVLYKRAKFELKTYFKLFVFKKFQSYLILTVIFLLQQLEMIFLDFKIRFIFDFSYD